MYYIVNCKVDTSVKMTKVTKSENNKNKYLDYWQF